MHLCHHGDMKALLYIPIVLSLLVLGAHFLRESNVVGVAVAISLVGLLFVRRAWAARVVQVALILGTVEWILTLFMMASVYAARAQPATRMIIILGSVAVITLVSAMLFQTRTLRGIYRVDAGSRPDPE